MPTTIFANDSPLGPALVTIDGDRIVGIEVGIELGIEVGSNVENEAQRAAADCRVDLLLPGLIDLQVNGFAGVDLMTCSEDEFHRMNATLAQHGVTTYLPTLISEPLDSLEARTALIAGWLEKREAGASTALGLHLEGPFLAPTKRGAHPEQGLRPAHRDDLLRLFDAAKGHVRLVTLAPELPRSHELIDACLEHGVLVSLGHSEASFEVAVGAIERGARLCTHFGNAMRGFHQREPGLSGAVLADPRITACVIPDGIHVHDAVLTVLHRCKGSAQVILVSDAIAAAGLPDGEYQLANEAVTVVDGACRNAAGVLAGSSLRLAEGVARYERATGAGAAELCAVSSGNAARLLGLEGAGYGLRVGARADLVGFERGASGLALSTVFVAGRSAGV